MDESHLNLQQVDLDPVLRIHEDLHDILFQVRLSDYILDLFTNSPISACQRHYLFCSFQEMVRRSRIFELHIFDISHFHGNSSQHLPNLETLKILNENSINFALDLFYTSPKLRKIILPTELFSSNFVQGISDFFRGDNAIKELELGHLMAADIFLGYSDFRLKLESLSTNHSQKVYANFDRFLATQAGTLRKLELHAIDDSTLKLIIESMNILECLNLNCIQNVQYNTFINYANENPSVYELKLKSFSMETMKLFLNLFPNLKTLKIKWATEWELKVILRHGKNLEKIYFDANHEESQISYNKLKARDEEINQNIQLLKS
jgi:hypothetical protein